MHHDHLGDPPRFLRLAGYGPFVEPSKEAGIDTDPITIAGYDHMDMFTAAANRLERRENEVFMPMIDFMIQNKK